MIALAASGRARGGRGRGRGRGRQGNAVPAAHVAAGSHAAAAVERPCFLNDLLLTSSSSQGDLTDIVPLSRQVKKELAEWETVTHDGEAITIAWWRSRALPFWRLTFFNTWQQRCFGAGILSRRPRHYHKAASPARVTCLRHLVRSEYGQGFNSN